MLGGLGCVWDAEPVEPPSEWRRTNRGWELTQRFNPPQPLPEPALRPWVVGGFQLLVSLAALVGFDERRRSREVFPARRRAGAGNL